MGNIANDLPTRSTQTNAWLHRLRIGRGPQKADSTSQPSVSRTQEHATSNALLDCYVEGWAEANPLKIMLVSDPGYQFEDPLIGLFSRTSLHRYFHLLRTKFAVAGIARQRDVGFVLHGPANDLATGGVSQFYREAPQLGLTGVATITVGRRGVIAETVAYDSNLALDVLRRALPAETIDQLPSDLRAHPSAA